MATAVAGPSTSTEMTEGGGRGQPPEMEMDTNPATANHARRPLPRRRRARRLLRARPTRQVQHHLARRCGTPPYSRRTRRWRPIREGTRR